MEKITKIVLVGQGMQIKILLNESSKLKELAEECGLYEDSLISYLNRKIITNKKFIRKIEKVLQKPFNELAPTEEEQLEKYIITFKENIKDYNTGNDNEVIDHQYTEAMNISSKYYQLMATGNLGLFRYNIGLHYDAIKILQGVVEKAIEEDFKELIVYYSVQLAFVYLSIDLKKSRNALSRADDLIKEDDLSKETLFNYYHFYGVVLKLMEKYKNAREIFHKALEYATDDFKEAKALSNIGMTYYREKKYKYALLWSRKALDKGKKSDEIRRGILNNIANVYFTRGEVGKANVYLAQAMEGMPDDCDAGTKIPIYATYLELNAENGERVLGFLLDVFRNCTVITQYHNYLGGFIQKLFLILKKNEDHQSLIILLNNLIKYTRLEGEKRSLDELRLLLVEIMHYLIDKGVYNVEKAYESSTFSFTC